MFVRKNLNIFLRNFVEKYNASNQVLYFASVDILPWSVISSKHFLLPFCQSNCVGELCQLLTTLIHIRLRTPYTNRVHFRFCWKVCHPLTFVTKRMWPSLTNSMFLSLSTNGTLILFYLTWIISHFCYQYFWLRHRGQSWFIFNESQCFFASFFPL